MWPALLALVKPMLAAAGKAAVATAATKAVSGAMTPDQQLPPGQVPPMEGLNLEALLQKRDGASTLPRLQLKQY